MVLNDSEIDYIPESCNVIQVLRSEYHSIRPCRVPFVAVDRLISETDTRISASRNAKAISPRTTSHLASSEPQKKVDTHLYALNVIRCNEKAQTISISVPLPSEGLRSIRK